MKLSYVNILSDIRCWLLLVFLTLLFVGGCAAEIGGVEIAAPIIPDDRFEAIAYSQALMQSCAAISEAELDRLPANLARELVVLYANSGRDMFGPDGPDGYVIRVIPLSGQSSSVSTPAEINLALFREVASEDGFLLVPVKVWIVPMEQAEQYWFTAQMLDGYLFRLAWGGDDPGLGRYRLVARLNYSYWGREYSVCGYVDFIDNVSREPVEEDIAEETALIQ
ncbi:MAG: hypothetical protein JW936_10050 [Sedimentisphaerales bacterium]|nr:hypothetical protein [Sedimentisphaerales bacterium]